MHADGRLAAMLQRSNVSEADGHEDHREMLKMMMQAEQVLAATIASTGALAADHGDTLTEDLAIERGRTHDKVGWILRAYLQE